MAIENGIVVAPIGLHDVAQALGESSEDVATLCTSEKINPWARYKPVRVSPDVPYTPDKYWKGIDGNCGWEWSEYGGTTGSLENMINLFTEDGKNGWTYDQLSANGLTFLRITDFEYYKHDAQPPFGRLYPNNEIEVEEGTESIFITPLQYAGWHTLYDLSLKDIQRIEIGTGDDFDSETGALLPMRFGVFLYGIVSHKAYYRRIIGDPLWNDEELQGTGYSASLSLDISGLPIGEYNIYPIFANRAISGDEIDVSILAIPVPHLRYATLKIVAAGSGDSSSIFSMYGIATQRKALDGVYIDFKFTFTNNTTYDKTISNNYIVYYPNSTDAEAGGSTYTRWDVDDITVAANSVQTLTISKLANDVSSLSLWKYSFGDGEYAQGPMMIQQSTSDLDPAPIV